MPPINYLAVVVAAVATFGLGSLWYSPLLFAKPWMKLHGYSEAKLKDMQKHLGRAYGISLFCYLVIAAVVSVLIAYTDISTWQRGVQLGVLIWIGFAAAVGLVSNMFSDKSVGSFVLDAAYQLVYLVMMCVILAVWR